VGKGRDRTLELAAALAALRLVRRYSRWACWAVYQQQFVTTWQTWGRMVRESRQCEGALLCWPACN